MNFLNVYIITGDQGAGKTSFLSVIAGLLKKNGILPGGILAIGEWKNEERTGFKIEDIHTGLQMPLAYRESQKEWYSLGKFYFNPSSVSYGNSLLQSEDILKNDVIILDEIGPFELKNEIWATGLNHLCKSYKGILILSVRKSLVRQVISHWGFTHAEIIDINQVAEVEMVKKINELIEKNEDN